MLVSTGTLLELCGFGCLAGRPGVDEEKECNERK